ncbi:PDR/VanB family oxidoreductase [Herbaspirillum camelliae]|uniref:PDR/VanB family oxidoreductase n=1 Tax=Herbaspirillum camelliae TaxID=1892903 RepID=UPI000949CB90|nr:PDR/VanB family oxidoreductase [Herbaspirillum camelliae]
MTLDTILPKNGRASFRVLRKWPVASEIVGVELVPLDGASLPVAPAGSHIEIVLPSTDGKPLIRHYSLCNSPSERDSYLVAIKREPTSRGGSAYIHEVLTPGHVVEVSEPRDQFPLVEDASHHLLFAGGIGITPLLSMAQKLHLEDRPFKLVYFARTLDHVAFPNRLENLGRTVQLQIGYSPEDTEESIKAALASAGSNTHVYVCGPAPFISTVERLSNETVGPDRFHCEHFGAAPVATGSADKEFEVELAKSGKIIRIKPHQTIIQALEETGLRPEISCEQGVCGTCLTRVLAGEPDHRDSYLSAAEKAAGKQILICVSRSKSERIVLDI